MIWDRGYQEPPPPPPPPPPENPPPPEKPEPPLDLDGSVEALSTEELKSPKLFTFPWYQRGC